MSKKEKNGGNPESASNLGREIWGMVFVAMSVLVFVSLASERLHKPDNILGRYLGTYLASGLVYFFGAIPSLLIPIAIFYIGWIHLEGKKVNIRTLMFWAILTFEICVLLAIHNLPKVGGDGFDFATLLSSNCLGNSVTYFLHFIFGPHRFGPYFIFALAFVVTVVIGFRINIKVVATSLGRAAVGSAKSMARVTGRFIGILRDLFRKKPSEAAIESDRKPADRSPDAQEAAETLMQAEPRTSEEAEGEARRQLEEDLAAFRAKKNEPIKITTLDISEAQKEPVEAVGDDLHEESEHLLEEEAEERSNEQTFMPSKPKKPAKPYRLPTADILSDPPAEASMVDRELIEENSHILEKTLLNFGIEGKVVNVSPGPVINRYEIELAPGIKVSRVLALQDDISMAVGGQKIRIQAPIPGKAAIGIELPNPGRQTVHFKHVFLSDAFRKSKAKLPVVIGKNISGMAFVADITRMPHLLIAGQTGSGKSVCINSLICSLLMTKTPEELRMIMIDPKKVELAWYEGIPHLLSPVVTESKEAVKALQWGVIEMERRYRLLAKAGARNLDSFNTRIIQKKVKEGVLPDEDNKPLPFIVIVVDELADLMMTATRDVEGLVQRTAQLARAVGIHLIVSTQRPSVDIITGPIKANLTSRIAFRTIQSVDSRTILGHIGAEKLLGMGDMLFLRNGAPDIERYHGAFIPDEDIEAIVTHIRDQYVDIDKIESFEEATSGSSGSVGGGYNENDRDELFEEAAKIIVSLGQGSTSLLQRRMKIGYARAGRVMDELEAAGIVGPQEGSKVREVLIRPSALEDFLEGLGY